MRFLARVLGFLLLAAAFVVAVLDGSRTIANGALAWTSLGEVAAALPGAPSTGALSAVATALRPLGVAPAALVALVLGAVLVRLGQPPPEAVGTPFRR